MRARALYIIGKMRAHALYRRQKLRLPNQLLSNPHRAASDLNSVLKIACARFCDQHLEKTDNKSFLKEIFENF